MSTDQTSNPGSLFSPNERLAILAAPVFGGNIEFNFERNNFFNSTPVKPRHKDDAVPETIKIDTPPPTLFRQVLKSMGEPLDPELDALLESRRQEYVALVGTGQSQEIDELVAAAIPINSALSQAFTGLREFLDAKYDRIFDNTVEVAEAFGKFVVAQSVIDARQ